MTGLLTTFNFLVTILRGDPASDPLCQGAFAECDGLEITTDVVTIREGGNNVAPIHLAGPVSYGTLQLKRGMTRSFDLWSWVEAASRDGSQHERASAEVAILGSDRSGPLAVFRLSGCLPVRVKAPALAGLDGGVAIEELDVAYQTLSLRPGEGEVGPRA